MNKFPLEYQIQGCQIQALSLLPSAQSPRVDIQLLLTSVLILPHAKSPKEISRKKISPRAGLEPCTSRAASSEGDHYIYLVLLYSIGPLTRFHKG